MRLKTATIITLASIPLLYIPITENFYDTAKWMVLVCIAAFILMAVGIHVIKDHQPMKIPVSLGTLSFFFITLVSFVSLLVVSTNKIEALVNPFGPVTWAAITICMLFLTRVAPGRTFVKWSLFTGTTVLGVIAIFQFLNMGAILFPSVRFLRDPLWTPAGTTTSLLTIVLISISVMAEDIIRLIGKKKESGEIVLLIFFTLIALLAMTMTVWQLIQKNTIDWLPQTAGLDVMLGIGKHMMTLILGVGAENYVNAYAAGRPVWLTATNLWNVRFATGSSLLFHLGTVYGLAGGAGVALLIGSFLKSFRGSYLIARLLIICSIFFMPPALPTLVSIAMLYLMFAPAARTIQVTVPKLIRIIAGFSLLAVAVGIFYSASRYYLGEYTYFRALNESLAHNGTEAYRANLAAITLVPHIEKYHITLSQLSLALSASLGKQDTTLVNSLIEQAISEAKIAVSLNRSSAAAWENLGLTYQTLIPVAPGSDNWALSAYTEARTLDPTNPELLLALGNVLIATKKYDEAVSVLTRATILRPSNATIYYNLAHAYIQNGDMQSAITTFNKILPMVPPDSSDYVKIKNELDTLVQSTRTTQ